MQKLYKVAFQRILAKIGADKSETLNVQALQTLLKDKNVPLSEIDQTIFHKLPRQEVKNLVRNPCPINKAEQTSSHIVTNAKAVRGALNIVEKKVCFKCPFVAKCDKAFIQPPTNFTIQAPLESLLITMKHLSEVENQETFKNRGWFSGVRVCDSLNSVFDDLMTGGQEFKIFKTERNLLRDEAEAQKQNQQEMTEKQLIKKAKRNKVPFKDVYAQVPSSKKVQNNAQKEGEQVFQELSKGPEDIFKKKKSDQFLKIAQKYLNDPVQQSQQGKQDHNTKERKPKYQRKQFDNQGQNRRPYRNQERNDYNQRGRQNVNRQQKPRYQNRERRNPREWEQNQQSGNQRYQPRRNDRSRDQSSQNYNDRNAQRQERSPRQYDRNPRQFDRNTPRQYDRNAPRSYDRNTPRQFDRNSEQNQKYRSESQERDPRIRRFSKEERPNRNYQDEQSTPRRNKMDKFYSEIKEQKTDEQEILSSFNRRDSQPRSNKLPRDAKYQRSQRVQGQKDFSEREMKDFDRMEKVPKILKTQFASKEDVQQRAQQQAGEEASTERRGRRIKRE